MIIKAGQTKQFEKVNVDYSCVDEGVYPAEFIKVEAVEIKYEQNAKPMPRLKWLFKLDETHNPQIPVFVSYTTTTAISTATNNTCKLNMLLAAMGIDLVNVDPAFEFDTDMIQKGTKVAVSILHNMDKNGKVWLRCDKVLQYVPNSRNSVPLTYPDKFITPEMLQALQANANMMAQSAQMKQQYTANGQVPQQPLKPQTQFVPKPTVPPTQRPVNVQHIQRQTVATGAPIPSSDPNMNAAAPMSGQVEQVTQMDFGADDINGSF